MPCAGWCYRTDIIYNYGKISDPKVDAAFYDAREAATLEERDAILKDIYVYTLEQAWDIALPQPITYVFYQPYMHGYAGEYAAIASHIWLDPVLKKQMGH